MNSGSIRFIYMQGANWSVLSISMVVVKERGSNTHHVHLDLSSDVTTPVQSLSRPRSLVLLSGHRLAAPIHETLDEQQSITAMGKNRQRGRMSDRPDVTDDTTSCSPRRALDSLQHIIDIIVRLLVDLCFVTLSICWFIKHIPVPY